MHHPYQSFQPVIALLQQAARDPAVAAIKMTVYRTGAESELMEVLISAARSGSSPAGPVIAASAVPRTRSTRTMTTLRPLMS